ncbi:acyl-protein synthetase [Candidatus Thioglobus sp.]|nr:acyl-protein synthetase [Candidatus Thioglobus sp.]MDA9060382.1 acyl-protein synthetase [Candidatus Thioglobus sp.]
MNSLTKLHLKNCQEYNTLMQKLEKIKDKYQSLPDVPFIPVRLFKHAELLSVQKSDIIKTMTSSGTSGQNVSKIFLDKETSQLQVRVLSKIMSDFIGKKRLPMLIIDTKSIISNRLKFSARTAGVLGFSMFGQEVVFALEDDMTFNFQRVKDFLDKYKAENILIFGFTFIIWKHFVLELEKLGKKVDLSKAILLHGGGWKQLENQSVDNIEFKKRIFKVSEISKIHNYYGMVEQTGSIFVECEHGFFHSPSFSDLIIRNHKTHSPEKNGVEGLIQLLSVIPKSYPGHSILTEDLGTIHGEDDCKCGRMGKYFTVHGRIKSAEIRGCSDTYSS